MNTTSTTVSYGSSDWITKITEEGEVNWTDDVFIIVNDNNAYSYVTLPNDANVYSVEEFMSMFLMD